MNTSWRDASRWLAAATLLLVASRASAADVAGVQCPPEAEILPCRCTLHEQDLQIWCSHSDLPKVLAGLRAVGSHVTRPIDELILENNNLPSLPGGIFSTLRVVRLMLRDNGLERVAASWLQGMDNSLLELFVVEPHLRSIPTDSLEQLRGLEAVTIQAGAMKRMPRFAGHPRLRYIRIQSPAMADLVTHSFKSLPDLEELHVTSSPRLNRMEAGTLSDLPRLRLVNISDCGLNWLHPRAFSRLPSLSEISLVGNRLSDAGMVGRALHELPVLTTLRLNDNMIERLTEASFVDLRTLQEINLAGNRITELQRGAFHLVPSLRKLDLSNNRVYRVHPEAFLQRSDSGLEELWLVHNELDRVEELRALLETLPRLRYLDVSYNFIQEIPFGALHGHPTLERLHLDHNRIQHVQREAFMAMPALRELRLRNNSLSTLMEGPMWNLPALKGLDLSHNIFRRLDTRMLGNLPSLRRLDLSGNALAMVDPDSFLATPNLEHVNLSGNSLVSFHPSTFQHLLGLYELDVGVNQLRELVPGLPRGVEYLRMPRNQITSLPGSASPTLKLPALKLLDLSGNGINRIPIGSLGSLSQLRTLNLAENAVQQLEDGCLNGLSQLESLDLHDNRLLRIHSRALRDVRQLRDLNLNNNRIENFQPELLLGTPQLRRLDISRNQLASIPETALANTRILEKLDASRNGLTEFPEALRGLSKLQTLDLSHNRLKQLPPSTLNTLVSLAELRLAKNKFQELPEGTFRDLPNLTLLDLDSNELEKISSRAIRSLPSLKAIRLSHNRLPGLPESAFSDLPELLSAELQENQLSNIAGSAFNLVPHIVLLNLSYNQLDGLDQAGLTSLKSLEVLDLSHNKVARVSGANLAGMEGLVELKMDDNRICSINGSPFNSMGRLRVLSLKNNKISSLSEPTFQHLRANVATLDVAGNPLSCSCGMLWLQAWLQESSADGPRCADGSLLREVRLSRQNCDARNTVNTLAPGCEADPAGLSHNQGTSQIITTWMEIKDSTPMSITAPSPEDSEYFYDEYVEYPLGDGNITINNSAQILNLESIVPTQPPPTTSMPFTNGGSSHYIPGDTPTLYAGVRHHKNQTGVFPTNPAPPPRSGLTFFGIPLPSINIGSLWGAGGSGRKSDAKPGEVRFVGARGKAQMQPPPTLEEGFMPMRPESGGFMPIVDPQLHESNHSRGSHLSAERQLRYNYTSWDNNRTSDLPQQPEPAFGDPRTPHQSQIEVVPHGGVVNRVGHPKQHANAITNDIDPQPTNYSNNSKYVESNLLRTTTYSSILDLIETDGRAPDPTLEPHTIEANVIPESTDSSTLDASSKANGWPVNRFSSPKTTTDKTIGDAESTTAATTVPTSSLLGNLWGMITANGGRPHGGPPSSKSPSSLSALLVPGGQQPQFKPAGGKPTITKVTMSPSADEEGPVPMEEYLRRAQPNTIPRSVSELPNDTLAKEKSDNGSMEWYFKNYNKTNLEPYVGPGKRNVSGNASRTGIFITTLLMVIIPVLQSTMLWH